MAARKKTSKVKSTTRKARARTGKVQANVIENAQHVWLAGMGAVAKAQKDGPAAFQEAVAEGLQVLTRSRTTAEKMIHDVFASAQGSASETWDNLEALFQSRVHKALQQLGVPSRDEIRLLTKRVAELNDNVKALAAGRARNRKAPPRSRAKRKSRTA